MWFRDLSTRRRDSKEKGSNHDLSESSIRITTTTNVDTRRTKHTGRTLVQRIKWPVRLITSAYNWLTFELNNIDEKKNKKAGSSGSSDELVSLVPSITTFVVGLMLVNYFGDIFDSMINFISASGVRLFGRFVNLLTCLTCDELEGIVTACVIVLFWIGGFRIVANIIGKIRNASKLN